MRTADGPDAVGQEEHDREAAEHAKIGVPQAAATSDQRGQRPEQARRERRGIPHEPRADGEAAGGNHALDRVEARRPHRAQRDQCKGERQHRLRHPRRDAGGDDGARFALAQHELVGPHREHHRHGGRHRGRQRPGPFARRTRRQERAGRERQHRALARGQRCAQEADPEDQMLDEGNRAGNARARDPAEHDFGERQHEHQGERHARQGILEVIEDANRGRPDPPRLGRNRAAHLAGGRVLR